MIALGLGHLERSARGSALTVWHLRAEIAALHALAPSTADTDWARIVAIYDQLRAVDPSPVVELARAVALGRARGPDAGLAALPAPNGNPYGHAATAIFLTELGRTDEARVHFEKARKLARTPSRRRRLLERRLRSQAPEPRQPSARSAREVGIPSAPVCGDPRSAICGCL